MQVAELAGQLIDQPIPTGDPTLLLYHVFL